MDTQIILNDIKHAMANARRYAKITAKMHNITRFISLVNPLQKTVQQLFNDLLLEDSELFRNNLHRLNKFTEDINMYWYYCQGDKRIVIK